MSLRRGTAREGNEMGFGAAIEFGRGWGRSRPRGEGSHRPDLQEASAHAGDGGQAHVQRLCNPLVRPAGSARCFIGFEQNPGMGLRPRRGLAGPQHRLQRRPLFLRERDPVLDARSIVGGVGWENRYQFHPRTLQKTHLPVTPPVMEH